MYGSDLELGVVYDCLVDSFINGESITESVSIILLAQCLRDNEVTGLIDAREISRKTPDLIQQLTNMGSEELFTFGHSAEFKRAGGY